MNSGNRFRSNYNRFERRSRERPHVRERFRRSRSTSPRNRSDDRNSSRPRNRYSPNNNRVQSRSPRQMRFSPPRREIVERFHERSSRDFQPIYELPQRPLEEENDWKSNVRDVLESDGIEEEYRPQIDESPERDLRNQLNQNKQIYVNQTNTGHRWDEEEANNEDRFTNTDMDLRMTPNNEQRSIPETAPWHFIKGDGHPDIPTFNGENQDLTARQFLKIFEEVAILQNWSAEEKKVQLGAKLVGPAREWFFRDDKVTDTWGRIKRSMVLTFLADMDYFQALQKMMQRTIATNETYNNYFTYKSMLLKNCGIVGRKAVSCIIGGLESEDLKYKCIQKNFATPELLYNFLMEFQQQPSPIKAPEPAPIPAPFVQFNQPHQLFQENQLERERLKKCFICKERGHLSHSCPHKQQKNRDENTFNVVINGTSFRAINDLKSEVITIRLEQANIAKIAYNHEKRVVWGYKGALINTIGETNILLRIQNAVVNVQIFIVTNFSQDVPVVLGNTLRHHKDIVYVSDVNQAEFQLRSFQPSQNSSFHMNEMLVNKANNNNMQKKQY